MTLVLPAKLKLQQPVRTPQSHEQRMLELASHGFQLVKLLLYQDKRQIALDIADSLQNLPLRENSDEFSALSDRLDHISKKYVQENSVGDFLRSWLRYRSG